MGPMGNPTIADKVNLFGARVLSAPVEECSPCFPHGPCTHTVYTQALQQNLCRYFIGQSIYCLGTSTFACL